VHHIPIEKENYAGSENHSPHQSRKRSHFGIGYRKSHTPHKKRKKLMGARRVAGMTRNQA
jgi:hypothetical protein